MCRNAASMSERNARIETCPCTPAAPSPDSPTACVCSHLRVCDQASLVLRQGSALARGVVLWTSGHVERVRTSGLIVS